MPFASVAKKNQQNVKLPIGIEDFAELRKNLLFCGQIFVYKRFAG